MKIDKDNIKIILILLVVALGIGYSYLNTELNINGTANINSANWNVYWNNVQVKNGSVEATTPTIDSNKTTVSFNVTLTKPGDYYEFTVDAVNAGTIDAMIESVNSTLNGAVITTLPTYLDYDVAYADNTPLDANQELLHDSTETYKVRISYKDNISASDLPGTNQSLSLQFSVTYKQADENSQSVDHPKTVYVANLFHNETPIYFEQTIPNTVIQYNNLNDAIEAIKQKIGYDVYAGIRHVVKGGLVKESYIDFIITSDMENEYEGVRAGTYSLKGTDNNTLIDENTGNCKSEYYNSDTGLCESPYFLSNKETLLNAFGENYCVTSNSGIYCSLNDYYGVTVSMEYSNNRVSMKTCSSWYVKIDNEGSGYVNGQFG